MLFVDGKAVSHWAHSRARIEANGATFQGRENGMPFGSKEPSKSQRNVLEVSMENVSWRAYVPYERDVEQRQSCPGIRFSGLSVGKPY